MEEETKHNLALLGQGIQVYKTHQLNTSVSELVQINKDSFIIL